MRVGSGHMLSGSGFDSDGEAFLDLLGYGQKCICIVPRISYFSLKKIKKWFLVLNQKAFVQTPRVCSPTLLYK